MCDLQPNIPPKMSSALWKQSATEAHGFIIHPVFGLETVPPTKQPSIWPPHIPGDLTEPELQHARYGWSNLGHAQST